MTVAAALLAARSCRQRGSAFSRARGLGAGVRSPVHHFPPPRRASDEADGARRARGGRGVAPDWRRQRTPAGCEGRAACSGSATALRALDLRLGPCRIASKRRRSGLGRIASGRAGPAVRMSAWALRGRRLGVRTVLKRPKPTSSRPAGGNPLRAFGRPPTARACLSTCSGSSGVFDTSSHLLPPIRDRRPAFASTVWVSVCLEWRAGPIGQIHIGVGCDLPHPVTGLGLPPGTYRRVRANTGRNRAHLSHPSHFVRVASGPGTGPAPEAQKIRRQRLS